MSRPAMPAQNITVVAGLAEGRQPVLSALVKRSYDIVDGQPLAARADVEPFLEHDVYYAPGDPETCTVMREDEMAPYKPATDVVVIAQAHAPEGRPVQATVVGVEVAGHRKTLRVIGDRVARHRPGAPPDVSDPVPFVAMPMRYERAYGGCDFRSRPDRPFHYPRNSLGRGVALRNLPEVIDGLKLPNIEDPGDLLVPERIAFEDEGRWNEQPLPQGFGWFQKTWYPRCSFAGVAPAHVASDVVMREEELGLVPRDQVALNRGFRLPSFDVRFNNGASPGLAVPNLLPGTLIRLARLTPEGMLSFTLPERWPEIMLDIGLGENALSVALHTVSIRAEERRADLVWRGAHPYPGYDWLPEMQRLRVEVA